MGLGYQILSASLTTWEDLSKTLFYVSQNINKQRVLLYYKKVTFVVISGNSSKALLACSIPKLYFCRYLANLIGFHSKINSDCSNTLFSKGLLCFSSQEGGFSYSWITYKNNFKSHWWIFFYLWHLLFDKYYDLNNHFRRFIFPFPTV